MAKGQQLAGRGSAARNEKGVYKSTRDSKSEVPIVGGPGRITLMISRDNLITQVERRGK